MVGQYGRLLTSGASICVIRSGNMKHTSFSASFQPQTYKFVFFHPIHVDWSFLIGTQRVLNLCFFIKHFCKDRYIIQFDVYLCFGSQQE